MIIVPIMTVINHNNKNNDENNNNNETNNNNNINNNNSNIFPYFDHEFIHIVNFSSHLCFIYDYYYYH